MTGVRAEVVSQASRLFRGTLPHDQALRTERTLAVARAFIAAAALAASSVLISPELSYSFSSAVLLTYAAFASWALFVLHVRPKRWTMPAVALHVVDLAVAIAVAVGPAGARSPLFLLILFSVLGAAYRWGFAETVVTSVSAVLLLSLDALLVHAAPDFILRAAALLVAGLVIGYLGRSEKQRRMEVTAIAEIVGRVDVRAGLKGTLAGVFDALLQLFGARRAVLVAHEIASDRLFIWDASRSGDNGAPTLHTSLLDSRDLATFMFEPDAGAWHAVRPRGGSERFDVVALDADGGRLKTGPWAFPEGFLKVIQPFDGLMAIGVGCGAQWTARVFFVDPAVGRDRRGVLESGRRVVRHIAPAVQNVYLLRRLRSAASGLERARIARELHDGVIQGVMGVEMQVAALSRRFATEAPHIVTELGRLNAILRQEIVSLRELMQEMKPLEVDPDHFVDALADFVQRFQRETGIAARFVTQLDRVALTPNACREVARILSEALINVRRHSGARNVYVRLATVNGDCRLSIDDDGCGFPFAGRMSQAELVATHKGPVVIEERVRLLGGHLTIESDPGRGARLEIAVPLSGRSIWLTPAPPFAS